MNNWPLNTPPLPLEGAPMDTVSEDYTIFFRYIPFGRTKAIVFDSNGLQIDILIGDDFQDAYDKVREAYPQAKWDPEANNE